MEKFLCKIDSKVINDLNTQISNSRILNWAPNYNKQAGISYDNLSYILEYWRNEFSWTKEEEKLNKIQGKRSCEIKTQSMHVLNLCGE